MDFRGVFDHGIVRPTEPVNLPDGTEVHFHAVLNGGQPGASAEFWSSLSAEQFAARQGVKPLSCIEDMRGDWPDDESLDDFLREVREGRK